MAARPRLFLIDAFGFIFRAFHARARSGAPAMRTSTGLPTEAVYIFASMLRKLASAHQPELIAAVFESPGPTFREQEFAEYKAHRPEMPPELAQQIPYVERLLKALRIPVLQQPGYEADDLIGTLAGRAPGAGLEVAIVSSDKDMLQLVGEHVSMLNPRPEEVWYDAAKVAEKMGVSPAQVPDLLALMGDASDNIPGAPGIGEKGARELITRFGTVEEALKRASEVERRTYRESLQQHAGQIRMSKRLATIERRVPVEFSAEACRAQPPDLEALRQLYRELEFFSLLEELGPEAAAPGKDYRTLETVAELAQYLGAIPATAPVAVAVMEGTPDLFGSEAGGGLGLCWRAGEARAAPWELLEGLSPWLEDAGRPKAAHDVKSVRLALGRRGIEAAGFGDDVMLYAFLLYADPGGCALEALAQRLLERKLEAGLEAQADCVLELAERLSAELDARGLRELYATMELPLAPVLARMEQAGIRIDPGALRRLSELMTTEIGRLTGEIHALAGHPLNINSPQQLAKVLFEEMRVPAPARPGKGKGVSTAADVLEELAGEHPIARLVLDYRQLAKLKGTYVDALPELINPRTGRVHTSFNQAGAATGRLSSSNPNLQNIPIRTELGREIRAAFIPRAGWKLLVADYSQIELRLLAHFSADPVLVAAFQRGEDVHARTASEVFGVPPEGVTAELRRRAKAVNFGIVYGLSAFGLAAQLGIPRGEAQRFIDRYFERYAGVKRYLEASIEEVRQTGVTRTLFGRERAIPDINSRVPSARGFAERTAVNTPLQGTAADLIKLAMIAIDGELRARRLAAAMLLQVHDELVLEAPPEELEEVAALVKGAMEGAHPLAVPLVASVSVGDNWRDAK